MKLNCLNLLANKVKAILTNQEALAGEIPLERIQAKF